MKEAWSDEREKVEEWKSKEGKNKKVKLAYEYTRKKKKTFKFWKANVMLLRNKMWKEKT